METVFDSLAMMLHPLRRHHSPLGLEEIQYDSRITVGWRRMQRSPAWFLLKCARNHAAPMP